MTVELRIKAQIEARKEAQRRLQMILVRFLVGFMAALGVFFIVATDVLAREVRIPEVSPTQLQKILATKDFVAVFWYSRHCRVCDKALDELETIDDEAGKFSIDFVKVNDKRFAKSMGIRKFPSLSFFQDGQLTVFNGDITNEEEVLRFLTSDSFLIIPDKIENVNADTLISIVGQEEFVAALFYDDSDQSDKALNELEKIDDEADVFKIRFVKINDLHLAEEYSLANVPALVYFRNGIPIVYHGELLDEDEVLEWLIQNQTSAKDEDILEEVTDQELDIMIQNVDHLLVFFHDNKRKSKAALESLENVDDDCDRIGVSFVKVDDPDVALKHGIEHFPTLIYFEKEIPSVYEAGDVLDNDKVMSWLVAQVEGSEIEEVGEHMLETFISREEIMAVFLYKVHDKASQLILESLEQIDDELDRRGILFVKSGKKSKSIAKSYGIESVPALVVFHRGVPRVFTGDMLDPEQALLWILNRDRTVHVVTKSILERLTHAMTHVVVLFYNRDLKRDNHDIIFLIESIEKELRSKFQVTFVSIDNSVEAQAFGVSSLPGLVLFEKAVPNLFQGPRRKEAIISWITTLVTQDTIEEVNDQILETLMSVEQGRVVTYVYHKGTHDETILADLERIDGRLEKKDIHIVKLNDDTGEFADKHGIDIIPSLVIFKDGRTLVYRGDISAEHKVAQWILQILVTQPPY